MHSSVERQPHASASNVSSFMEAPMMLAEPTEDVGRPARGILIACGISLVAWGAALSLLF